MMHTFVRALCLLCALLCLSFGCRDKKSRRGSPTPNFAAPDVVETPLGSTISFSVSATDPSTGNALLVEPVSPFPLLPTASFDASSGVMTYAPQASELGEREFVFGATDSQGVRTFVSVLIRVTARAAGSGTELSGQVLDSDSQTPIVGVEIRVGTQRTETDAQGRFLVPDVTVQDEVVTIDGGTATGSERWTFVAEDLELLLGHMVFEGQVNVIPRPVYLPKLGTSAGTIDPSQASTLSNPEARVEVVVSPRSARMGSELFSGEMFIPEVEPEFTPASLPEDLQPAQVVAIQPAGLRFDPPARITFPNTEGLEAGTMVDIFSVDPESGLFEDVGDARVSGDGLRLETVSGGVRFSSWHFPLPGEPGGTANNDDQNGENESPPGQCSLDGSRISIQSGNLAEEHELLTYRSLGEERGLRLVYNSIAANPCPTINTTTFVPSNVAVPEAIRTTLVFGGVAQTDELFTQPSRSASRIARQVDATGFPTGWYPHEVEVTSLYPNSSRTRRVFGSSLVLNEMESPFGAGWSLEGLARIRRVTGWPFVVLTEGDGGIKTFTPVTEGGPTIPTEICFTIDGSGSMTAIAPGTALSRWDLQREGMARAVEDPTVIPRDGSVTISVVQFAGAIRGGTQARVEVQPTVVDTEATATTLATEIRSVSIAGSGNPMYDGIDLAVTVFSPARQNRQIICITSDGDPGNDALAAVAADNAIGVGIDSIDILAVGAGADVARLQPIVRNGNLTLVPTFVEFAEAAGEKLRRIINGAPAGEFSCLMTTTSGGYTREFLSGERQEFNAAGLLTSQVDRNGNDTQYVYDSRERLARVRGPAGQETRLTYDANGLLDRVDHPGGGVTRFTHSGANLTSVTDPDGATRRFSYDGEHRLTVQVDKRGNSKSYAYDASTGRLSQAMDESGETTELQPSQTAGVLSPSSSSRAAPVSATLESEAVSQITSRRGFTSKLRTDRFGRVLEFEDPLGNRTEFERDSNGLVMESRSPRGRLDTRQYDSNGNLTSVTQAEGTPIQRTSTYRYDPNHDWLTRETNGEGHSTQFEYDPAGNLLKIIHPDATERRFEYDSRGLVTLAIDENGNETSYTYDVFGRLETVENALGEITRYRRDSRGNVLTIVEGEGEPEERTRSFTYDAMNRVLSSTDGAGGVTRFSYDRDGNLLTTILPTGESIARAYDEAGRLSSASDPLRGTTTFTYDEEGNLLSRTDARNLTTTFSYDEANRLFTVTDPASGIERYGYDASGNVTTFTNARAATMTYSFDLLERRTAMTTPERRLRRWVYDRVDNLLQEIQPGNATITHVYDRRNRRITTNVPSVAGVAGNTISVVYDDAGNIRTVVDDDTRLERTYDVLNRVIEEKTLAGGLQPVTTLTSSYDATGNRTRLVDSEGVTHSYDHDGAGRLTSIETSEIGSMSLSYDATGRLQTLVFPNGVSGTYEYLPSGRISRVSHSSSSGQPIVSLGYQTGPSGNINAIDDSGVQKRYAYDSLDRLVSATDIAPAGYAYDPVGNRLQSDSTATAVYNDDNQLLSDDAGTYGYDLRGNLSQQEDAEAYPPREFRWDAQNQLIEAVGVSQYRYDGLGRRVEKVTPSGLRRYVYDGDNILLEYDASEQLVARYSHGEEIDQHLAVVRAGSPFYYHADHIGSVRALTDSTGRVVNTYNYDSYGVVLESTELIGNPYWYTGREEARETGWYYYRARWYDPRSGRFVGEDPLLFDGNANHQYEYALGAPVMFVDRDGLDPSLGIAIASAGSQIAGTGAVITQADSPLPGPADVVGGAVIVAGGIVVVVGGAIYTIESINDFCNNSQQDDAKAPGTPSEGDGWEPPKNWDGKPVKNPNGPGRGYPDKKGNVWVPTGPGPRAHGGPHWDVQKPGGGHVNVYPGGRTR